METLLKDNTAVKCHPNDIVQEQISSSPDGKTRLVTVIVRGAPSGRECRSIIP
jgi:hypothetical protein